MSRKKLVGPLRGILRSVAALPVAAALVAAIIVAPLPAQAPPPAKPPANPPAGKKEEPPSPLPVIVDNTGEATQILDEQKANLADKDPAKRVIALEVFIVHRNEAYAKVLAPFLKDRDDKVAMTAARALGNQPFPKSVDALLDYATNQKTGATKDELMVEAVRALGNVGIGKKGFARLRERFDDVGPPARKEIIDTFVKVKEKQAFSLLVDNCDEPRGDNSAANPPASYWKKRFEEWSVYRASVRKGLKELTGESYATAKQYIDWAAGAGKKSGFVYERGH